MTKYIDGLNRIVWGAPALVLIVGVGLYLSLRLRFAQLTLFPRAWRRFLSMLRPGQKSGNGVTPFQALCTALAATVGTGNIVGVAGAICLGGPGAIFWMWICGVLGMVTKYAEVTLALRYRVKTPAGWIGGPMYVITQGLGTKFTPMAVAYCVFGVVAAFGVGNATQINAVISGINDVVTRFGGEQIRLGNLVMGLILAALVGAMLLGGARRIGIVAERLVPFISIAYILLCAVMLVLRWREVPAAFASIAAGAFSPRAGFGFCLSGASHRMQPRGVYQRGWHGHRVHRPRFGGGFPPGGTGADGHYGGFSRYHPHVYTDSAGHPCQRRAGSLRQRRGRGADDEGVCCCLWRFCPGFHCRVPCLLCLCHGAWLGAVRCAVRPVPFWRPGVEVFCRGADGRGGRRGMPANRRRLVGGRGRQRPDGDSQFDSFGDSHPGGGSPYERISEIRRKYRRWR